jgi:hypothetical protein
MGRALLPKGGKDRVMTPDALAEQIVGYFNPFGKTVLEPCKGEGAFMRAFEKYGINADWCEIDEGRDFYEYDKKVDWIITNPPYSQMTKFLNKSLEISDNIVFLCLANAMMFTSRVRPINQAGFGFKEIVFVDTPPKPWPSFGVPLVTVHLKKGYKGSCSFVYDHCSKLQ